MRLFFLIIFTSLPIFSAEVDYANKFKKLSEIKKRSVLEKKIINFRKENKKLIANLPSQKSYRPNLYFNALAINGIFQILPPLPKNWTRCERFKAPIKNSYKSSWEDLPKIIHEFWPVVLKACK